VIRAEHPGLGVRHVLAPGSPTALFCENETNTQRLSGTPNATAFVKDGIDDAIVQGRAEAVNPDRRGTKASLHYPLDVASGATTRVLLRLTALAPSAVSGSPHAWTAGFDRIVQQRRDEADEFCAGVIPSTLSDDARAAMRQALAGMLWPKQYYEYDVTRWLDAHGLHDRAELRSSSVRDRQWSHMLNADVTSMPETWEYPWYAAWDLAFHTVALALVDVDFAKG
jgi:hypothetical protein